VAHMTPERFLREIRYRIENYGTTGMYFTDMIFLPGSGPRTIEMMDRLIQCKKDYPDFNWWAEARVDTFSKRNIAEKMKASGCRHLKFGVEMGNQDMLNSVKKGINLDEVRKAFALAGELQIERTAYVLLGCPGFNDDDYKDMWHFFKDLNADNYVVNINVPYVGTELHEQVRDRLYDFGLYRDGEESLIHISLEMKEFWGISDETIDMYFCLPGKKDDSNTRKYKRKVVDRDFFRKSGKIAYIDSEVADPDSRCEAQADGIRT
jgi:anaerobic magnesium-protoporphyrin IX monomethyl ester cyclase